ncbi:hypothetical protein GGX14DRAFT_569091 [Mycena pura]|uniref:F-box domain-containing protein n=1 Tax=Mycena pura TaxID=153505 RepID=A0AAD6V791_9AGAR|nr:hypothetical protein GGX14DRAFT_569091 [Mycena pura]
MQRVDDAGGFGGTWYWNRYPELMCDIKSYIYATSTGYMPRHRYAHGTPSASRPGGTTPPVMDGASHGETWAAGKRELAASRGQCSPLPDLTVSAGGMSTSIAYNPACETSPARFEIDGPLAAIVHDVLRSHAEIPPGHDLSSIISSLSDQLVQCGSEAARLQDEMTGLSAHRARFHAGFPPGHDDSSIISSLPATPGQCDSSAARLQDEVTELAAHRARLQRDYDVYCSLWAPVRRLPSEILEEIFAYPDITRVYPSDFANYLKDLAQASLRTLSQVCARWRAIVMGTPALWSTITVNHSLWKLDVAQVATDLLYFSLERSGDVPLTLHIRGTMMTMRYHETPLDMLAQHSTRWRTISLDCSLPTLQHLLSITDTLPLLENFSFNNVRDGSNLIVPRGTTLLDAVTVPRLRTLVIPGGSLSHFSTVHLNQLHRLQLNKVWSREVATVISAMSRLSTVNYFRLEIDLWSESQPLQLGVADTESDVGDLTIRLTGKFDRLQSEEVLEAIFNALTLPNLRELDLESGKYKHFPLAWPHPQFLALCARSAFDTHLHSLCLYDVTITEPQLLQCLIALPVLEHLAISDHKRFRSRGVDLKLITDSLLRALTRTSEVPALVPLLESLSLRSRNRFTDTVFLDLVVSRVDHDRVFTCAVEIVFDLNPAVRAQLQQLQVRGDLKLMLDEIE